jgi:hypothetical protein
MPVKKPASAPAPRRPRKATAEPLQLDPPVALAASDSDAIARRAYEIFVQQGWQHGHDLDHWLTAERELLGTARGVPSRA